MTYLVYQRPINNSTSHILNDDPSSDFAQTYFRLLMPNKDNVEALVSNALYWDIYRPTMIISADDGVSLSLHETFDAGNGYPKQGINVSALCKHPSMSVGDLVVDLYVNHVYVCMPTGWHHISNGELKLSIPPRAELI